VLLEPFNRPRAVHYIVYTEHDAIVIVMML
jgi:hypothetical protein